MPNITKSTADAFIPEVWSMESLRATEQALVMAPLVKRYDSMVQGKGDALHIPSISNFSANNKTANNKITLQSNTESDLIIYIDKHKEVSFVVEDIVKVQSNNDLLNEYTSKAGYAIAEAIDTDIIAESDDFSNSPVGNYGNAITDDVINDAILALDIVNAPLEDRNFIFAPEGKNDIQKIDKFVTASAIGRYDESSPIVKGPNSRYYWGDLYGIPVFYTTGVPKTLASPTQIKNILFHREALALALQQAPRTQAQYDIYELGNVVSVDTIYGVRELRADFGIIIRS